MKLQYKILAGFAILAFMLFVAGAWSIIQIKFFGERLEEIIGNEYQKIVISKTFREMIESQDRETILRFISNEKVEKPLNKNEFLTALEVYKNNYSNGTENKLIKNLKSSFMIYEQEWEKVLTNKSDTSKLILYKSYVSPSFNQILNQVKKLVNHNQNSLLKTAQEIRSRARRAIIPGIVAIIAAIVFTLLFNYFINHYIVKPINTIKKQIDDFIAKGTPIRFNPIMDDEISKLSESIYLLSSYANIEEHDK